MNTTGALVPAGVTTTTETAFCTKPGVWDSWYFSSKFLSKLEHDVFVNRDRDVTELWDALLGQPGDADHVAKLTAFTRAAWASPLEHVGSFLAVAKAQGRNVPDLWDALLGQSDDPDHAVKLTAFTRAAWASPLEHVSSFLAVGIQDGRDAELLWRALEVEPDRLAAGGRSATVQGLAQLGQYAPPSVFAYMLRDVLPGHWDLIQTSESMNQATWLALNCHNANRDDLAADLHTVLLRRASASDCPPRHRGFSAACALLAHMPKSAAHLVDAFLAAVCTTHWLRSSYATNSCARLAAGLRQVAFSQPPEVCAAFNHPGLGRRLRTEFANFERADPSDRAQTLQLLGCAALCGCAIGHRIVAHINIDSVTDLPLRVLPHRATKSRIEMHQLQLWLGLRTFASITKEPLHVPHVTIEATLDLWRTNLKETASDMGKTSHRVNESMVAWLESCLSWKEPALIPSGDPLWALAGLPRDRKTGLGRSKGR